MLSDTTSLVLAAAGLVLAALVAGLLVALRRQRRATAELAAGLASRVEVGGTQLQSRLDGLTTLLNQRLDAVSGSMDERLRSATESLDRRLAENTERVDVRLGQSVHVAQQSTADVGQRLESVSRVVADVQESLGRMGEASRRILEVGQDLRSLQDILRAPKLRGGLGELFLADVLGQILPRQHFTLQHRFRSGETVDAVVRLGGGLVPIDSKFPLEGFRRLTQLAEEAERRRERRLFVSTVKRHADSIAKKYILPDEGTFDFALMYIPAENVYYEAILRDDDATEDDGLLAHALARRVIPVSPCSFYAYLQAIVLGLKGLQVEQRAREIADHLDRLQGDFGKFGECFDLVGKHLKNAQNTFEKADGMRKKLEAKLEGSARLAPPDEAPLEPDPGAFPLFDAVEGARSG